MLWRASDLHEFDIKATDGAIGSVDDFLFRKAAEIELEDRRPGSGDLN